ncbi:zinc finger Y-chromosomal protein 2-like [Anticarsia gemmatalis]|uniref:zinc finger Y-chromosomal protein 2-like n=1 Tax=Anticarsia gemmatalis TaxID=129554 RepID=UPI003F75E40A
MDINLCRLCLNISNEQMWKLFEECNIHSKIQSSLNLNIPNNVSFPNHICSKCFNKVEEMYEFCAKIKENEKMLQQNLEKGSLVDYYLNLHNVTVQAEVEPRKFDIVLLVSECDEKGGVENKSDIPEQVEVKYLKEQEKEIPPVQETLPEPVIPMNEESNDVIKDDVFINSNIYENIMSDDENLTLCPENQRKEKQIKSFCKKKIPVTSILKNYNCLTCDIVCDSHIKLKEHYKSEHTERDETIEQTYTETIVDGKTLYNCDKCNKKYCKKYIKSHLMFHRNDRPYFCKLCGRTYKTVSDIMRHGYRAHSGLKLLHCSFKCGFSTSYTGALKEHEIRMHKNTFPFTCDKCGRGFFLKTWYEQHQNIHNDVKPFICDVCGVAFHMAKQLSTHRTNKHPQSLIKKPYICRHCNMKCDSITTLGRHLDKEHAISKNEMFNKKALCDFCGLILNSPGQLQIHKRMHLGEKPYSCSICHKSFRRKFSMQVHERAHGRARPHACATCGRLYSQRSALYRHQRLHHGPSAKPS